VLDGIAQRLEAGDKLVFLGNYLGYGPDVGGALDRLVAIRRGFLAVPNNFLGDIVFLRGWQEEMWHKLLQLQLAAEPRAVLQWMLEHGLAATLASYGFDARQAEMATREGAMAMTRWSSALRAAIDARPGHRALLGSLKHAAATEDGKLLFVHAGFDPGKPLELQGDVLWWGGADLIDRAEPIPGFERLVRGFDRHHGGLTRGAYTMSLDGGAGFGGPLLAARFDRDGMAVETLSA
jgi:serine/threonine protein phosphatase 1